MFDFISDYKKLKPAIINVIVAEFFIQMVNATFMNILPLYMNRKGFSDEEIALFITFRFLRVILVFFLDIFLRLNRRFELVNDVGSFS